MLSSGEQRQKNEEVYKQQQKQQKQRTPHPPQFMPK